MTIGRDPTPRQIGGARVAVLTTLGADDGAPHAVPIVFALVDSTLVTAVDHKPKRSRKLRRLRNIEADDRVAVIVHHYDEDWRRLWWVRGDGRATIETQGEVFEAALDALQQKYEQYSTQRPAGPVITIDVDRWVLWPAPS